jgi:hypothetical protein
MGKGSNPGSNTAIKEARAVSTGTEGAGNNGEESGNVCLLKFTERLLLRVGNGIAVGDSVAIVPSATDASKLDIYIGASPVGVYDGENADLIRACIAENYTYRGAVNDVRTMGRGIEVSVTVQGHVYE